MSKVAFGIVGCGGAALSVCAALAASDAAAPAMVYDIDAALAQDLGQRYHVPAAASLGDLLASPAIDVVYIAAPHDQLAPLARSVLAAGKHALVEKPMALTLPDADALIALAAEKHLKLGVFYEMRNAHAYTRARELIQSGAIGKVIAVRIQTLIDKPLSYWQSGYSGRSSNPWRAQKTRAGGGVTLMNTSHQLDAIRWLTGLEIVRVSAQVATLTAPVEVEDIASASLVFDNGALGSLLAMAHTPGAKPGIDECFDIIGAEGQLKIPDPYGEGPLEVFLRNPCGDIPAGVWHSLPTHPVDVFKEAVDGFALAVRQDQPAPASGQDARHVLAAVLAIYQSAQDQQAVAL